MPTDVGAMKADETNRGGDRKKDAIEVGEAEWIRSSMQSAKESLQFPRLASSVQHAILLKHGIEASEDPLFKHGPTVEERQLHQVRMDRGSFWCECLLPAACCLLASHLAYWSAALLL